MSVSGLDRGWLSAHLGDEGAAALFSDEAEIAAMVRVEMALAAVQGSLDLIPAAAANAILATADTHVIDAGALANGAAGSGIPVPALVAEIRRAVPAEHAPFVHFGATTQDIIDTGLVLRLMRLHRLLTDRIAMLIGTLASAADAHRDTVMAARTWGQLATPTTFGLRIAGWLAPLLRHRARMAALGPRLGVLQWGGASGTLASFGADGEAIEHGIAHHLGLTVAPKPWHAERDTFVELASTMAMIAGTLGKMGADLKLMAATGEARAGAAGGSSTMPQKANPIGAEALLALARFTATQASGMFTTLPHAEERDAGAWQAEWLILPPLAVGTASALRHAQGLAETLVPDPARMHAILDASNGTVLAEAAQFALARHMPRTEATALVKTATARMEGDASLFDILPTLTDAPVDWDSVARPETYTGEASRLIDRVLAEV